MPSSIFVRLYVWHNANTYFFLKFMQIFSSLKNNFFFFIIISSCSFTHVENMSSTYMVIYTCRRRHTPKTHIFVQHVSYILYVISVNILLCISKNMIFPLGNLGNNVSLKRIFVICKRKNKLMLTYGFEKVLHLSSSLGTRENYIFFFSTYQLFLWDERRTSDRIWYIV